MVAKILIAVGFFFLLVWAGPTVIDIILRIGEAGQQVKDVVQP